MSGWTVAREHGDPGLSLFGASLRAGAPMTFGHPDGARWGCLEVGCCEADWLHAAGEAWPECWFSGIDTRAPCVTERDGRLIRSRADVMESENFPAATFDAIVSLSAIEHVGLGHYGDPKDPDGDTKALANCWRWLKPGGWLYFDVPYAPLGYAVIGTSHRQYDDDALVNRLMAVRPVAQQWDMSWIAWAKKDAAGVLVEKPTTQSRPDNFDHYVAMVWQKAA